MLEQSCMYVLLLHSSLFTVFSFFFHFILLLSHSYIRILWLTCTMYIYIYTCVLGSNIRVSFAFSSIFIRHRCMWYIHSYPNDTYARCRVHKSYATQIHTQGNAEYKYVFVYGFCVEVHLCTCFFSTFYCCFCLVFISYSFLALSVFVWLDASVVVALLLLLLNAHHM